MTIVKKNIYCKDIIYIFLIDKPNQGVCLGYPGASTVASQSPVDRILPPWPANPCKVAMRPHSRYDWIRNIEDGMGEHLKQLIQNPSRLLNNCYKAVRKTV